MAGIRAPYSPPTFHTPGDNDRMGLFNISGCEELYGLFSTQWAPLGSRLYDSTYYVGVPEWDPNLGKYPHTSGRGLCCWAPHRPLV